MKIVGYADKISVQPGDKVRFMVSCEQPSYKAQLTKLIHGDINPDGPGVKEKAIKSAIDGSYPGKAQKIHSGSYVTIPDSKALRLDGSFTLTAWVYPTTPTLRAQGLLTKWSAKDGKGYALVVDADGALGLWLGGGSGKAAKVGTGAPMRSKAWYFVAASYDAASGKVSLYQLPHSMWPRDDSRAAVQRQAGSVKVDHTAGPFLMAAWDEGMEGNRQMVGGCYNGKVEAPAVFARALSRQEVERLQKGAKPGEVDTEVVAAWDFARDFSNDQIRNAASSRLNGKTVNRPCKAMTGHNWSGDEPNYKHAPEQYGAIYFHDDDLDDAGWDVGFELTVPKDLKSGVYAAKLTTAGGEDYVPFFVRPPKGTATAPVLFLVPTCSYLAYANIHVFKDSRLKDLGERVTGTDWKFEYPVTEPDKYIVANKLNSLYDRHTDGSGVSYSSRLRPILNMRPKYVSPLLWMGKGCPHQFNADLHLVDWLDEMGYNYDVATDEDLQLEGAKLLKPYHAVITGSHPEYWSGQMLDALEAYLADGGRHMYLGGNGYYWVTSFAPESPHCVEVRRWRGTEAWEAEPGEYYHATTGELGGLWRFRGRPPQKLVGVGFTSQGFDYSLPYKQSKESQDPRAKFIFKGVGKDEPIGDFGLVQGGAGGFEVDRADVELGTPPHALVMATTTGFSDVYQHVIEEVLYMDGSHGGSINPLVRGDLTYFEGPKGGGVFSVGSISWCGSLSHNNYDNNVSRITKNVLDRFVSEEEIK
jgi:N,N-dimethylformamidase